MVLLQEEEQLNVIYKAETSVVLVQQSLSLALVLGRKFIIVALMPTRIFGVV